MAIIDFNYKSHALMHPTTVKVVLPDRKKAGKTMYFLHGAISDAQNCLDNMDVQEYADRYEMAFVIPSCGNTFYIDHGPAFGNYGKFVGSELVDVTRNEFGFSRYREDTAIAGFSMGGYGAIRNGLKYSNNYGYIIGMSAACVYEPSIYLIDDSKFAYFKEKLFDSVFQEKAVPGEFSENYRYLIKRAKEKGKRIPKIYLACGIEEELVTIDDEFSEFLRENKIEHVYIKEHGEHDWKLWSRLIEPAIRWFVQDDLSSESRLLTLG